MVAYERSDPSSETLLHFCQTLKSMQARHTNVVQTMAQVVLCLCKQETEFRFITLSQGVLELQESHKVDNQTDMAIQYFLDRFYMSRISMRMLIHQHTLLFEPDADHNTNRYNFSLSQVRVYRLQTSQDWHSLGLVG